MNRAKSTYEVKRLRVLCFQVLQGEQEASKI